MFYHVRGREGGKKKEKKRKGKKKEKWNKNETPLYKLNEQVQIIVGKMIKNKLRLRLIFRFRSDGGI